MMDRPPHTFAVKKGHRLALFPQVGRNFRCCGAVDNPQAHRSESQIACHHDPHHIAGGAAERTKTTIGGWSLIGLTTALTTITQMEISNNRQGKGDESSPLGSDDGADGNDGDITNSGHKDDDSRQKNMWIEHNLLNYSSTRMLTMRMETQMVKLYSQAQWFFNTLLNHAIGTMANVKIRLAVREPVICHKRTKPYPSRGSESKKRRPACPTIFCTMDLAFMAIVTLAMRI